MAPTDPPHGLEGGGLLALLTVVQGLALGVLFIARDLGIIADEPFWLYAGVMVGAVTVSRRLDRWSDTPRGSRRLHLRVAVHAAAAALVIYLTGWGPVLGICFVFSGLVDLSQSGSASWRAVLGWSLVCCAAGQALVLVGWMPSFRDPAEAQGLDPRRVLIRDRAPNGRPRDVRREGERPRTFRGVPPSDA